MTAAEEQSAHRAVAFDDRPPGVHLEPLLTDEAAQVIIRLPARTSASIEARQVLLLAGWRHGISLRYTLHDRLIHLSRGQITTKVGPDGPALHPDLSVAVALLRQSHQVTLVLHRQDPEASEVLVAIHPVLPRLTQAAIKGRKIELWVGQRNPTAHNPWTAQDLPPDL